MSFHPVTMWQFRCDGVNTWGQCGTVFEASTDWSDKTAVWMPVVAYERSIRDWEDTFKLYGWLVARDGRLLCPEHVAAAERMVQASIDGLPFEEAA